MRARKTNTLRTVMYITDATRCGTRQEQVHALHAIDAQQEPTSEPQQVANIEIGAEMRAPAAREYERLVCDVLLF